MDMKVLLVGILLISLCLPFTGCFEASCEVCNSISFEVVSTDAPNGRYWVSVGGVVGGNIVSFRYYKESRLEKSYTVEFLYGDRLMTIIGLATDPYFRVHFTDDNESMSITVNICRYKTSTQIGYTYDCSDLEWEKIANGDLKVGRGLSIIYDLYIPNPELYGDESDEM